MPYRLATSLFETGAGQGNRTLVVNLEGFSSTIELDLLNASQVLPTLGRYFRDKSERTSFGVGLMLTGFTGG